MQTNLTRKTNWNGLGGVNAKRCSSSTLMSKVILSVPAGVGSCLAKPNPGNTHSLGAILSDKISVTRDAAADAVAIVRLLRTSQPDMAMFIVSSYADDPDSLQALTGAVAALANALLNRIENMSAELNRSADTLIPGADAVLASAAAAVVSFDADAPSVKQS